MQPIEIYDTNIKRSPTILLLLFRVYSLPFNVFTEPLPSNNKGDKNIDIHTARRSRNSTLF
jgi:hypothetical protein